MATQAIHELSDRDLNKAIAVRVLELRDDLAAHDYPRYTHDLTSTWLVVEKLRELGWLVTMQAMPPGRPFYLDDEYREKLHKPYTCKLTWMRRDTQEDTRRYIWERSPWGFGDTFGQAVCRAALESVGEAQDA